MRRCQPKPPEGRPHLGRPRTLASSRTLVIPPPRIWVRVLMASRRGGPSGPGLVTHSRQPPTRRAPLFTPYAHIPLPQRVPSVGRESILQFFLPFFRDEAWCRYFPVCFFRSEIQPSLSLSRAIPRSQFVLSHPPRPLWSTWPWRTRTTDVGDQWMPAAIPACSKISGRCVFVFLSAIDPYSWLSVYCLSVATRYSLLLWIEGGKEKRKKNTVAPRRLWRGAPRGYVLLSLDFRTFFFSFFCSPPKLSC